MNKSDIEYIEEFFRDLQSVTSRIPIDNVEQAIAALFAAWHRGSRVYVIGNGGSAATASHFASDLSKCTIVEGKKRMKALSLVDNMPLFSAIVNDEGWENVYVEQLKNFFEPADVLVVLSVHGGSGADKAGPWSQNLLKAVKYVKDNGGVTIGFSGFDGGALKAAADVCVVVPIESTAHVEAFHVVLHHLIAFRLREKIEAEATPR